MNIKFISDDNLPLNKPLKFNLMTITIRSLFEEDGIFLSTSFSRWYFVWIAYIKMLEYERIDISEGIDVNKTSLSKDLPLFVFWRYWF